MYIRKCVYDYGREDKSCQINEISQQCNQLSEI